ncbi:MAG: SURF1 family protein [Alphaproteobacteria bacterium]|nr:SURF1 family protein [Alphaproteobacteria bacterium]
MTFKPTLGATVAAALAVLILIGLGTWQLDRREWKSQVIESRAQRVTAPAMTFLDIGDVDTAEYRPVRLTGRYRVGDSIKLLSRTRAGKPGYHIVTPFEIDGAARVVLVDRGWVPVDRDPDIAVAPDGLIEIEGFVRRFEIPNRFTPDNDPVAGDWFYLDGDQLASALNLDVAPIYVQLAPDAAPPGAYPQGDVPNVALRNPHLQYAVTWYALALVLLVIYVIFHARRRVGED